MAKIWTKQVVLSTRLIKYGLIGVWNAVFGITLFLLTLEILGNQRYQLALLLSFLVATMHSHLTQRSLVWKSQSSYLPELARFTSFYIFTYVSNAIMLWLAVEILKIGVQNAQIAITFLLTTIGYLVNKKLIFRQSSETTNG